MGDTEHDKKHVYCPCGWKTKVPHNKGAKIKYLRAMERIYDHAQVCNQGKEVFAKYLVMEE